MIIWKAKPFSKLSISELHDLFQLRAEIFVVEQDCVYLDIDGKDKEATHVLGYYKKSLVAYARLFFTKENNKENNQIGRVCVKKTFRNKNIGDKLIQKCLDFFTKDQTIKISAQQHLKKFYNKHQFISTGKEYLEDGIPHIEMIRKNKTP